MTKLANKMKKYIIAGLLVWLPIWITLAIINFIVKLVDNSLSLLPKKYNPSLLLGVDIPGIGLIFSFVIVLITGIIFTNYFGKKLISYIQGMVKKIPLVRSIYNSVQQVFETLFASNSQSFRKVLLIEYPRKGIWSIGFLTGDKMPKLPTIDKEVSVVFIPTTPNPTSGFFMMIPKDEIIELDMTVDDALKMVISLGVVQPSERK